MQMRMMHQAGSPSMQDGEETDLCTQVFRISSYRA